MERDELVELEERGWQARSSSPEAAAAFYEAVLGEEVLMLLPGGMVLEDRAEALQVMAGQTCSSYHLSNLQVLYPTPDTAMVTYGISAEQGSFTDYVDYPAAMSSLWVRRGDGWKLTFHQRTPCRALASV